MPLALQEQHYATVERELREYLWRVVYEPIVGLLDRADRTRANSLDALTTALRRGTISYAEGEFSGDFTRQISAALSRFADFDRRSKTWRVRDVAAVPATVTAAGVVARDEAVRMAREIERSIDGIAERIERTISTLGFSIDAPLFAMDREISRDLHELGVEVEMTERLREQLTEEYTNNQHRNIQNWSADQTVNLRQMVERYALNGYRRNQLRQLVAAEWGVTDRKARFLARQETGLLLAAVRRERFTGAGVQRYRWSTSRDERVRNRHRELHGQVFAFGQPPITDARTGQRNEPGEDYNCRCVAIPILE